MSFPAQVRGFEEQASPVAHARAHAPASSLHHLLLTARSLLEFITIALFVVTFVVQPFRIPSESMLPTLHVGDFLLVDKQAFAPEHGWARLLPPSVPGRGDLAVFRFPVDPSLHLVKRIVALPGDRVRLRGGRLFLNGAPAADPYAFYREAQPNDFRDNFPSLRETDPNLDPAWWSAMRRLVHGGEILVPPDNYFVLGDKRDDSEDSRYWGFVPRANLVGRPFLVYFSLPPTGGEDANRLDVRERVRSAFRTRLLH